MTENVFLYVPNIIGYVRILLAFFSFYHMPTNYVLASWAYIISGLLDALDGHAARILNQSSKFGAMLDQLTDRCGTIGLLTVLGSFYPRYVFLFQLSMIIDISCHWLHLHTTITTGKISHKNIDANNNPLLQIYYSSKPVLFLMCSGNELFYTMLYLLYFTEGPIILSVGLFRLISWLTFPVAVMKLILALMQGQSSAVILGQIDSHERSI